MEQDIQAQLDLLKDYAERKIQLLEEGSSTTVCARVYMSSYQDMPENANTIVNFDTESFNSGGITFNSSTHLYTILTAGKYKVSVNLISDSIAGQIIKCFIYKNGTTITSRGQANVSQTDDTSVSVSDSLNLAVNDTISALFGNNISQGTRRVRGGETYSFLTIEKI